MDDEELIAVLADTKAKAIDVKEKLLVTAEMKRNINDKREQYRSIATRGSILYFSIVDMEQVRLISRPRSSLSASKSQVFEFFDLDLIICSLQVNTMYQTSLDQFQRIFDKAMDNSEKANLSSKRIHNIIDAVTYSIYRYVNRGLYEKDKTSFKLIMAFKMLMMAGKLASNDIMLFLRGGSHFMASSRAPTAFDRNSNNSSQQTRAKPFLWLNNDTWKNIQVLCASNPYFHSLIEDIENNESSFLPWFNEVEPEKFPVPIIEAKWYGDDEIVINFNRLLAIRCLREDRTLLAVNDFIRRLESIDYTNGNQSQGKASANNTSNGNNSGKIPALGSKYIDPITDTVESTYKEMDYLTPVVYLLSAGADPTDSIEGLARRKRKEVECISMGEGKRLYPVDGPSIACFDSGLTSWLL